VISGELTLEIWSDHIVSNGSESWRSAVFKTCLELDLSKNKTNFLDSVLSYPRLKYDVGREIVCVLNLAFSDRCMVSIVRLADLVHLNFCDDFCDSSGDDFRVW
jgi:hypothetical protein